MNESSHQRAARLIAAQCVEGIPPAERAWFDAHLESCEECAALAAATERAIGALRGSSPVLDPGVVRATQLRVRARALELQERQARLRPLWVACAISWLWVALTTPYLWRGFRWLGQAAGVSDPVWQTGFLLGWFLPATLVAAALLWRHSQQAEERRRLAENEVRRP